MSFYINCAQNVKNTGVKDLCQDLGPIAGYMLCPYNLRIRKQMRGFKQLTRPLYLPKRTPAFTHSRPHWA